MDKDVEILVSYINTHQKVASDKEGCINQVDKMSHSLESQLLSPAISVITQCAHAMVAEMEVKHGHDNMDVNLPKRTWPLLLLSARSVSSIKQYRAPKMLPLLRMTS